MQHTNPRSAISRALLGVSTTALLLAASPLLSRAAAAQEDPDRMPEAVCDLLREEPLDRELLRDIVQRPDFPQILTYADDFCGGLAPLLIGETASIPSAFTPDNRTENRRATNIDSSQANNTGTDGDAGGDTGIGSGSGAGGAEDGGGSSNPGTGAGGSGGSAGHGGGPSGGGNGGSSDGNGGSSDGNGGSSDGNGGWSN